jgi:hypothetical protein
VDGLQAAGGQLAGQAFEPVVDVVRCQSLELGRADRRDKVLVSEDAVAVDGTWAEVLMPLASQSRTASATV